MPFFTANDLLSFVPHCDNDANGRTPSGTFRAWPTSRSASGDQSIRGRPTVHALLDRGPAGGLWTTSRLNLLMLLCSESLLASFRPCSLWEQRRSADNLGRGFGNPSPRFRKLFREVSETVYRGFEKGFGRFRKGFRKLFTEVFGTRELNRACKQFSVVS